MSHFGTRNFSGCQPVSVRQWLSRPGSDNQYPAKGKLVFGNGGQLLAVRPEPTGAPAEPTRAHQGLSEPGKILSEPAVSARASRGSQSRTAIASLQVLESIISPKGVSHFHAWHA